MPGSLSWCETNVQSRKVTEWQLEKQPWILKQYRSMGWLETHTPIQELEEEKLERRSICRRSGKCSRMSIWDKRARRKLQKCFIALNISTWCEENSADWFWLQPDFGVNLMNQMPSNTINQHIYFQLNQSFLLHPEFQTSSFHIFLFCTACLEAFADRLTRSESNPPVNLRGPDSLALCWAVAPLFTVSLPN